MLRIHVHPPLADIKHITTGPEEKKCFVFWDPGSTRETLRFEVNKITSDTEFPEGPFIKLFVIQSNTSNAFKEFTCNGGRLSTFAGNYALWHSDVINVCLSAMFPTQRLLAGNCFIVKCHVTSKWSMKAYAVRKKFLLYNKICWRSITALLT